MARIYRTPVPNRTIQTVDDSVRQELSRAQRLGASEEVEQLGAGAADLTVDGEYSGQYADRLGPEFEELLSSPTVEEMPVYGISHGKDGYYAAERVDESPTTPKADPFATIRAGLSKKGTRNTHWLAVATAPYQPSPGHPFGTDTSELVGLPAAATHVRAVDTVPEPSQRTRPTPAKTVSTRHGDVDLYDASSLAFDPIYLYDLPYDAQGDVDPGVWDTFGDAEQEGGGAVGATVGDAIVGSASVGEMDPGVVAWQRVFDPAHEYVGEAVLENGLLRLEIDEDDRTLRADRYDADWDRWRLVSLPARSWEPVDLDVTEIGRVAVRGQLEFVDADTGDVYALNFGLHRGYDDVLWWRPAGEADPVPTGLQELLDPIASESVVDTQDAAELISREEVRK